MPIYTWMSRATTAPRSIGRSKPERPTRFTVRAGGRTTSEPETPSPWKPSWQKSARTPLLRGTSSCQTGEGFSPARRIAPPIRSKEVGLARILGLAASSGRPLSSNPRSIRKLVSICRTLLSERGGVASAHLATDALEIYHALDQPARRTFLDILNRDFSPDPEQVGAAADAYRNDPSSDNLLNLQRVVEPPRQELFRRLNLAPEGMRALVQMRSQVLREIDGGAPLETLAADLGHLLTSWFNRGFLTLERIDWRSSAALLQKLIDYEAVHQIQGWPDLRRRLEADRRCYAFFHPALPDEPLILSLIHISEPTRQA